VNTFGLRTGHGPGNRGRQQGISLLIVLLLLVVTSLLGIAILRSSSMQERMSANMRDRSIAMQAAEAAIRFAQGRLLVSPTGVPTETWDDLDQIPTAAQCTNIGICPAGSAAPAAWQTVPGTEYDSATLPVAPEYWIEYLGIGQGRLAASDDTRSEEGPDNQSPMFRITARSRAAGRAEVVLQTNVMSRIPTPGT
jgi:type IV pilus assembly protein PilX